MLRLGIRTKFSEIVFCRTIFRETLGLYIYIYSIFMHFVIAMMNHGGCIVFVGSALPFFNVFLRGYWLLLQSRGPLSSGPSTWPTPAQP